MVLVASAFDDGEEKKSHQDKQGQAKPQPSGKRRKPDLGEVREQLENLFRKS